MYLSFNVILLAALQLCKKWQTQHASELDHRPYFKHQSRLDSVSSINSFFSPFQLSIDNQNSTSEHVLLTDAAPLALLYVFVVRNLASTSFLTSLLFPLPFQIRLIWVSSSVISMPIPRWPGRFKWPSILALNTARLWFFSRSPKGFGLLPRCNGRFVLRISEIEERI